MILLDKETKKEMQEIFLGICKELELKIPEKRQFFRDLQREVIETEFNIIVNMAYLVENYFDVLETDSILNFIRIVKSL